MSFVRTFGYHFLNELALGDSSSSLLVELVHDAHSVLLADEQPSWVAKLDDLVPRDLAAATQVTDLEGGRQVEEWVLFNALSELLGKKFNTEVRSPEFFKVDQRHWHE